jgi:hypothetical protein
MKKKTLQLFGLTALLVAATNFAHADVTLFQEDFEGGDLAQWTGKVGEGHQGAIVADPLDPANNVLTFTGLRGGGDIFSVEKFDVSGPRRYVLSFDFLGLAVGETPPAEYGAFVGLSDTRGESPIYWVASTYPPELNVPATVATELVADGVWRRYHIDITDLVLASGLTELHVTLEDWFTEGSVPGDIFFDDIQLVAVVDEIDHDCVFEELVPCSGPKPGVPWKNHGQYVSAMTKAVNACLTAGHITKAEAGAIISAAARSDCGKPAPKPPKAPKAPKAKK